MTREARVNWMNTTAAPLYENWSAALLSACDTPDFWDTYREIATSSKQPNIDRYVKKLLSRRYGLVNDVDRQNGITEAYLYPYKDDILTYTSARKVAESGSITDDLEAVRAHAMDGLSFAANFSAGVANDTFLQHYAPDAANRTIGDELHLPKLVFVIRALGNASFIYAMQSMRLTGFDVLGEDTVSQIETRPLEGGWLQRALHCGLDPGWDQITSTLTYNEPADTFVLKPEVETHLRQKLRDQNTYGLTPGQINSAGPIAEFTPPISRGCPVQVAIGHTCLFTAKALSCTF